MSGDVDKKIQAGMQGLGRLIDEATYVMAGKQCGFFIAVFDPANPQVINYIANSERDSVSISILTLVKEWGEQSGDDPLVAFADLALTHMLLKVDEKEKQGA